MTDAPAAAPVAKTKKGGSSGDGDSSNGGKQRFEVKKVRRSITAILTTKRLADRLNTSGMLSLCGRGTSSSTTAPSVVITSWISVSTISSHPTKLISLY